MIFSLHNVDVWHTNGFSMFLYVFICDVQNTEKILKVKFNQPRQKCWAV